MELPFAGLHQLCGPLLDRLRGAPGPAARGAPDRVRGEPGRPARPLSRRARRAEPPRGGGGRRAPPVPRGRCAVAGQGIGADAGVRGAAPARGARRDGVRRPRAGRGAWSTCPTSRCTACGTATRGRCWARRWGHAGRAGPRPDHRGDAWQSAGAARAAARADARPSWPAASGWSGAMRSRGGSRRATFAGSTTLDNDARRLLLVAAAEPVGDPLLLRERAERLGIAARRGSASGRAAGVGERVTFRHPLVRSAVYRSADADERRAAHLALAEATDRDTDPDRRAWHLARGGRGPRRGGRA